MSCFRGRMREYRNISIDRFDGDNLKSTTFFLSHIHSDHTVGLQDSAFLERLQSNNDIFLYCSEITKLLLIEKGKYSHLKHYVRVLPVDKPTNVSVPQPGSCKIDTVQVTLLHAAHCPGSVMFLFEGSEGTCLYTGDFRWEQNQISKINALHEDDKSVKHIDSLYVDTTFCHESSIYIPSRDDSASAVYHLVKEWIGQGPSNVVHFTPRSQYGHEHLLKEVYLKTGHKIHVAEKKWQIYQKIPGLEDVFTSDPSITPVHACKGKWSSSNLPCGDSKDNVKVMVILPSTMYFTMRLKLDLSHIVERKGFIHRVCYSFHSSYIEVKDLVTYLQPKFVRPNVKPAPDDTILKVQGRLNEFLKLKNSKKICDSQKVKPLGKLRRSKFTKKRSFSENSSDSLDLCFGTPEKHPPPAKKAKKTNDSESEDDEHSSYAGSVKSDSEISDICEVDGIETGNRNHESSPESLSLPGQSLLAALDCLDTQLSQGSDVEPLTCRVCLPDDEEQISALVIPSSFLEESEYKTLEDDGKGDSSLAKGDNHSYSSGFEPADQESSESKKSYETLSTPGESLLAAADCLERAYLENIDTKPTRSESYEDKFMMFLRTGDDNINKNTKSLKDLETEEEIDRMILNSQNSEESSHHTANSDQNLEESSHHAADSDQNENYDNSNENSDREKPCEVTTANTTGVITIESSCSTINTLGSIPYDIDLVEEESCKKSNSKGNMHKKKVSKDVDYMEDLFGTDDENGHDTSSNDELVIVEDKKMHNKNKMVMKDSNEKVVSDILQNGSCHENDPDFVVLCEDSDLDEEEERSLLSGKKSLSRNNSLQIGVISNGNIINVQETISNVMTIPVSKLSPFGHSENMAIVLDDNNSDSDVTIPLSQQSDASIETMSPFNTPVKKRPTEISNGQTNSSSFISPIKKSPLVNKSHSILPYPSPSKNKSPHKLEHQVGDILSNEKVNDSDDQTSDSSIIDLTASDDDEEKSSDDDKEADETQDYYVID